MKCRRKPEIRARNGARAGNRSPRENLRCQRESASLSHEERVQPGFEPATSQVTGPDVSTAPPDGCLTHWGLNFLVHFSPQLSRNTAKISEKKQSKTACKAVYMKHWNCSTIWPTDLELRFAVVVYWRMEYPWLTTCRTARSVLCLWFCL
jgi:hypothetical protein